MVGRKKAPVQRECGDTSAGDIVSAESQDRSIKLISKASKDRRAERKKRSSKQSDTDSSYTTSSTRSTKENVNGSTTGQLEKEPKRSLRARTSKVDYNEDSISKNALTSAQEAQLEESNKPKIKRTAKNSVNKVEKLRMKKLNQRKRQMEREIMLSKKGVRPKRLSVIPEEFGAEEN